jgi:hypothetical protein
MEICLIKRFNSLYQALERLERKKMPPGAQSPRLSERNENPEKAEPLTQG